MGVKIYASENEYWAYDISTFSTWSECLKQAKYGYNKENDRLEQINMALIFGEQSRLPFYYRKLPGNISDVKTVSNILADMSFFDYKKIKLVMDRGFYSEDNINGLLKNHLKFIISTKTSLKYVKQEIDKAHDTILNFENYDADISLYMSTSTIRWNYSQERPYKGDIVKEERRLYLHIYYNRERAVSDEVTFNKLLISLNKELESGNTVSEFEKQYKKYFEVSETPKRGIKIIPKNDVMREAMKYHGYFALLTNEIKDPKEALKIYRNKDLVEKAFGNLKERLSFRRMEVSSELCLDGKMFVEFIALIYLSYIQKIMHDKGLFKDYTLQGVLDELDVIDCYEQPGCALRFGEITKRQQSLYESFNVDCPTSL